MRKTRAAAKRQKRAAMRKAEALEKATAREKAKASAQHAGALILTLCASCGAAAFNYWNAGPWAVHLLILALGGGAMMPAAKALAERIGKG